MEKLKTNIIIVDNSKEFCNILNDYILVQKDMVVIGTAENGIEALKLIEERKPDLVILNIIMPILDGLGVIEMINKMDLNPMPRIMVLSSVSQDKIIRKALLLGAEHYVIKPFDIELFIYKIRQMFKSTLNTVTVEHTSY